MDIARTFSTEPEVEALLQLMPDQGCQEARVRDLVFAAATPDDPEERSRRAKWLIMFMTHWILTARHNARQMPVDASPMLPVVRYIAELNPRATYEILCVYERGLCISPSSGAVLTATAMKHEAMKWFENHV